MIKYFHELTKDESNELIKQKVTWAACAEDYPQPIWCSYPDAVQGVMGCWSLMDFDIKISEDYCRGCDCYISKKKRKINK